MGSVISCRPRLVDEPDWMQTAWRYDLRLDQCQMGGHRSTDWLDLSGPDENSSLFACCAWTLEGASASPIDFVLAPIVRSDKLKPQERAEKPILITRFNKHSDEWLDATYYNVRTGKKCRITVGDRKKGRIPVKTYREILHQYLYHPECKFAGTRWASL